MSKIKIYALGGLNETGKNMYVIEIDKNILVFEAGLKYTEGTALGIDYIIPNIDYLKENKERIKGIFLTHGHDENIGALGDIIPYLNNVDIYASKFTLDIVKKDLEPKDMKNVNLIEIKPHKTINVSGINIFPVSLSHSIPDNLGYAVYTKDGVIFIALDFVFDSLMQGPYKTDIGKLAYIGKQGVLCLLCESVYAAKPGYTSPNHRISSLIKETLNTKENRIIFNVLTSHIYRIQELFNEVSKTNRKVIIMGKKLQNTINDGINDGYIKVNKDIIGDLSNINDNNVVILVSNEKEKPFSSLIKIVGGYDKYIKLKEQDTIFIAIPLYEGKEKIYYEVLDNIAKIGSDVVTLSPKNNLSHHASSEDIMLMIDLMKPKYYFPIKGEYRYQVENADLAYKLGIPKENIFLKQNGEVITIEDGVAIDTYEKVPCGTTLIDGNSNDDVGQLVLKDREILKDNGIVIVAITLDKKTKKILSGPEVLTRGFVYVKDNAKLIEDIIKLSNTIVYENVNGNYLDYNKIKTLIREKLSTFLYKETECNPMIITVLNEI